MSKKDDLLDEYIKLARKANRRLKSLENLSTDKNFKSVLNWSYRRAIHDIKTWGGNKRFIVSSSKLENLSVQTLSAMRNDVYFFLNSKTSTKRDIIKNYKEKTETFNKKYGLDWSWQDMTNYFENDGLRDKLEQMGFSSKTALSLVGVFRKNPKEVNKIINDFNSRHKVSKEIEKEVKKLKGNDELIFDEKNIPKLAELFAENKLTIEDFF